MLDYNEIPAELMTAEIMNLVVAIHEYKGKQDLFIETKPDILEAMLDIARIHKRTAISTFLNEKPYMMPTKNTTGFYRQSL